MFQCLLCDKNFKSQRGLNAHQVAHKSTSRYTVPRKRKTPLTFICENCQKESPYSHSTENKFCSNECQVEFNWNEKILPKVLAGEASSKSLKKYLIKINGYQCSHCGISEWNGKEITLQLDHIDGNSDNNLISNGRILCPNCHSQTDTFGSRNFKNTKRNTYQRIYKSNHKQKGRGR